MTISTCRPGDRRSCSRRVLDRQISGLTTTVTAPERDVGVFQFVGIADPHGAARGRAALVAGAVYIYTRDALTAAVLPLVALLFAVLASRIVEVFKVIAL